MRFKNLDLIVSIAFAIVSIGWSLLPDHPLAIGIILAVPLVLVLPGYTLTQILFHNQLSATPSNSLILQPRLRIGQPSNAVDTMIFSLGLSLAIDVVMGFILDIFPLGLQLRSWALSLGLLTIVFALLAAYLQRKYFVTTEKSTHFRLTIRDSILLGLAVIIAVTAVWWSTLRPPQPLSSFTQFWMLSANQSNNHCAVRIGLQNFESTPLTYHVAMTINGTLVSSWPSITLATKQEWEQQVTVKPTTTPNTIVDAKLYRLDRPETIYREVHVTLLNCFT